MGFTGSSSPILPDRFILHIWISGSDDTHKSSHFGILLHFHDGTLCWLKDWRLVYVRNADPYDGLISEGTQVHKTRVNMLIYCLHHNVVCALALKVQRLKEKQDSDFNNCLNHTVVCLM